MTSDMRGLDATLTPDLALGAAVTVIGLVELGPGRWWYGAVALAVLYGAAAGLHRRAPGVALGLVWASGAVQLLTGANVMLVQLTVGLVAWGCSRHGSRAVLWWSGLSIPLGALVTGFFLSGAGWLRMPVSLPGPRELFGVGYLGPLLLSGTALLFLAVPWLAGLAFRSRALAEVSRQQQEAAEASRAQAEVDRTQAEEIAALRERQARLANDVHDVVGHSLAVILAQAESAQFLPDDDPARAKETMANIATAARQSLGDVRQVLSGEAGTAPRRGEMDELIEGVRTAGHDVQSSVVGAPRPLPPEIDVVAYRALQEMLTNALKHGTRDLPVTVLRHWADDLTLSVSNAITGDGSHEPGLGLNGMRTRVESVGGRLDVRPSDGIFTVTARLPVRDERVVG